MSPRQIIKNSDFNPIWGGQITNLSKNICFDCYKKLRLRRHRWMHIKKVLTKIRDCRPSQSVQDLEEYRGVLLLNLDQTRPLTQFIVVVVDSGNVLQ